MQDHGQLSSPSPAVAYSPVVTSAPSFPATSRESLDSERDESEDSKSQEDTTEASKAGADEAAIDEAEELGRELSKHLSLMESEADPSIAPTKPVGEHENELRTQAQTGIALESPSSMSRPQAPAVSASPSPVNHRPPVPRPVRNSSGFAHPSDLSAQLYNNPAIAALRPTITIIPPSTPSRACD